MKGSTSNCLCHNVHIINRSVEEYNVKPLFVSVISRSFSTLRDFLALSQYLIKPGGQMLAMKGVYPLNVPQLSAERRVVELSYQLVMVAI